MGSLAQREEEPDLVGVDGQARSERGHARREQGGRALRPERQPDVGRADDFLGQRTHSSAGLAADHHPADPAHHLAKAAEAAETAEHRLHLGRNVRAELCRVIAEQPAHRVDGPRGDRVAQLRPDRQGRFDPLGPAPRLRCPDPARELGGVLQPEVGEPQRLDHLAAVDVQDARVALLRDRLPGDVLGQVPVHRAALPGHQIGELAQRVGELLRVAHGAERAHAAERPEPGRPPPEPEPPEPPPDPPGTSGSSPELRPGPKPKGGSVICPASRGHLPELSGRMEGSTLAKLSRERSAVSNRVAQVRPERSPDSGSRAPAAARGRRKPAGSGRWQPDRRAVTRSAGAQRRIRGGRARVADLSGRRSRQPARPVVAVTGAARGLGLALTARLAQSPLVGRVVAIDDNRGDVSGVTWRIVDVRDPALAGRLSGCRRRGAYRRRLLAGL